jgi:aminotransferase
MPHIADRVSGFTESAIREMTRLSLEHGAINLGQGFPDFPAPDVIKEAAIRAIAEDDNQYTVTWGTKAFREAIAAKTARTYPGWEPDPFGEVTVTCGATEGMIAAILGTIDEGDELVVFEPFYESYSPDAQMAGATIRYVTLHEPDWHIDPDELRAAFTSRTRGIIVGSPHNPTGKVFTRDELALIAELCQEHDVICFADEIYEHIVYDGLRHVPMATMPGMADRTVTLNAMSKTYSVTGWRVGWVIASPALSDGIRRAHDFMTVCAASPLQAAGITALALPPAYYTDLAASYQAKRDRIVEVLRSVGFVPSVPSGAYYVMADFASVSDADDFAFSRRLVQDIGVGAVPGSSFYSRRELGRTRVRFAFPKRPETLEAAAQRLARLRPEGSTAAA